MSLLQRPKNISKKHGEQGVSLVEVLVTLFLFVVGVLAVALLLDMSIHKNASARLMSEATEIAQYKMEKLMSASYRDAELDASSSPYGPSTIGKHSVFWVVQEDVPMSGMKSISLTVTWNDFGVSKSFTVDSIKQ